MKSLARDYTQVESRNFVHYETESSRVSLPGVFHSDFDVFLFVPFSKLRVIWVSYPHCTIINGQSKYIKSLMYE